MPKSLAFSLNHPTSKSSFVQRNGNGFNRNVNGRKLFCDSFSVSAQQGSEPSSSSTVKKKTTSNYQQQRRVAVLLCPAQFCVPDDYEELWQALPTQIDSSSSNDKSKGELLLIDREASRVVPLSRRDWIKVSRQLPTQEFWNANLSVHKTLDWYFQALEQGLTEILQSQDNDLDICLVGHSIGGWVARAYLGGLSRYD
jgi:hypothetical protein